MSTGINKGYTTPDLSTLPPSAFSTPLLDQTDLSLSPTTRSDSSFIEPNLRESRFRLFEATLLEFEKNNYNDITVQVTGNPFTAANRCRDAINSVAKYKWQTPLNVDALVKMRDSIAVRSNTNGTITIGKSKRGAASNPNLTELTIDCADDQSLVAISVLISRNQIPFVVKIINHNPVTLEKVLKKFNLLFIPQSQILCLDHLTSTSTPTSSSPSE